MRILIDGGVKKQAKNRFFQTFFSQTNVPKRAGSSPSPALPPLSWGFATRAQTRFFVAKPPDFCTAPLRYVLQNKGLPKSSFAKVPDYCQIGPLQHAKTPGHLSLLKK